MGKQISVVIPCYRSEHTIGLVVEQTAAVLDQTGIHDFEMILVNDGSPDHTYEAITALSRQYPWVVGVDLAKNSGQHNAILAGMHYAGGDLILGMDDDLQTHPSQIPKLLDKINEGCDVVYGRFSRRERSRFRRFGTWVNEQTVRFLIGKPKGLTACPMYVIRRFVRDEIIRSASSYTNLQGLFLRTTANIENVEIEHFDRVGGSSGYTLRKLVRLWSSFFNYSCKPVSGIGVTGLTELVLGIVLLVLGLADRLSPLYGVLCLLFGITTCCMGVLGVYIVRMFMMVSKEPQYVVRRDTLSEEERAAYEENAYSGRR